MKRDRKRKREPKRRGVIDKRREEIGKRKTRKKSDKGRERDRK